MLVSIAKYPDKHIKTHLFRRAMSDVHKHGVAIVIAMTYRYEFHEMPNVSPCSKLESNMLICYIPSILAVEFSGNP